MTEYGPSGPEQNEDIDLKALLIGGVKAAMLIRDGYKFYKKNETRFQRRWDGTIEAIKEDPLSAKEIFIDKNIEEQFNQNKEWVDIFFIPENSLETDKLISDFRQDELEVSRKSSRWIVARITKEGFNKLAKDTRIKEIFFNSPVQGTLDTSAPLINATKVWNDFNFTGKGIKICIIDSGVNKSQPYLANKIVEEYCYCSAPDSLLSSNDCCPDGTAEDNKAEDYYGHGTHVTGIIASQDSTYRGIAYNASIYEVKVLNSSNKGALVDIGDAIDWCRINASADVISISIGDGLNHPGASVCPYFLDGTINDAYNANISIIVASGNEEYITGMNYPACSPNVISVGSTTKSDDMSWFTNRPTDLDLLAPGESIISLRWDPHAVMPGCLEASNQFMICSGTSQATPHVAGAAALLLERDTTLTPDEIRQILRDTAKNITTNWKRIDVLAAINSLCTCTSWTAGSCGSAGGCSLNERKYTRTCSPSACDIESECRAESSCLPSTGSGIGVTVCASGCNYTTIGNAVKNSRPQDKIIVNDSSTYNEEVTMNSTTSGWLECRKGAKISGSGVKGIFLDDIDGPVVTGCTIDGFDYGIYLNSSYGIIQNNTLINNQNGVYLWKELAIDNDVLENNISKNTVYGIRYYAVTWGNSPSYNNLENNLIINNDPESISFRYGQSNNVENNEISDSTNYGVHFEGFSTNSLSLIQDNIIYQNDKGLYLQNSNGNTLNNNILCPSNTNVDIDIASSTSTSGDGNRCDKPGSWNDGGATGCTYYCDNPPTVMLLDPLDKSINRNGDIDFICYANDNYMLVNITLYHNITGTWQANETKNISGTSNTTTFSLINIPDGSSFGWNCLAYDNMSRGSFAPVNWTINITIIPPNVTLISPSNNSVDTDGTIAFNCSATDDSNLVNITLYGNWSSGWHANETISIGGTSNSAVFTKSLDEGIYAWNCLAYDDASQSDWADVNWTINVLIDDTFSITACQELNQSDKIYKLQNDVSSNGTCFTITANNIVLDGQGHNITYNNEGYEAVYGVDASSVNGVQIINSNIKSGSSTGEDSHAIYLSSVTNGTIENNTLATIGDGASGIYLSSVSNTKITNNKINTTNNNAIGIKIISSSNNTFRNIDIKTSGSSAFGIDLYGLSDNNLFYDSIINASHALSNNTYFESNAIGILNFTNVTSAYKKTDFGANSDARLNVHWYFEAEVKNSTGYQVANANVSAWDKNNLLRFSALTNADGNISKQTLIEYMQNATKKTYYTNYIINATKNDSTASQSINLTANMFKTFILPITIILNASNIKEDGYAEYYNSIYSRNNLSTTAYIGYPYYMDRGYVEFNTSLIPDNANITKVILNLSMSSIMSSIYCDLNPIETRPSIASNTNLYNDAGNGTAYINNDNFCSTKYYPSLNLGSNANNDLKNLLSSNWFAVGIRTDPESASKYASFYTSESSASPILIVSYT